MEHCNRLAQEKSPYLLQHAHNPVNWFPWGGEAFEKARREEKPVFLSIGYSTCHWCHVMERESFEDSEVAALLNRDFISVKVDREERPDVDAVYMEVCQAVTGQGGWPLTIVMTPEQKPFFAATYLPKSSRYGMAGMTELLPRIAKLWKTERRGLEQSGEEIQKALLAREDAAPGEVSKELIYRAAAHFENSFDPENGGFGSAPKFPSPQNLLFLLRYAYWEKNESALAMAEKTLGTMARGGLFDQIGGGFSRYSTDDFWLAPHFEKMLYDNAMLLYVYAEAYQVTGNQEYRKTAERTAGYVLRELTYGDGGFFCGQDADSEGEEGKYYTFTPDEVLAVLGERDGARFDAQYDITSEGNFEGKNIPNRLAGGEEADAAVLEKLYRYRLGRTALHKDDKILTAWNGLMIAALAKAGRVFENQAYLEAAEHAWEFVQERLMAPDGTLAVRWRDGETAGEGKLDDYSCLIWALLELYAAGYDAELLAEAVRLADLMVEKFFDAENGGFYLYASDGEQLISRPKEVYDGASPSGNSVAAAVLWRLSELTAEPKWREYAQKQFAFLAGEAEVFPAGFCFALCAMMGVLYPSRQLVCAGEPEPMHSLECLYQPNLSVLVKTGENSRKLEEAAPFTREYPVPARGARYYLCRGETCGAPVESLTQVIELLEQDQKRS